MWVKPLHSYIICMYTLVTFAGIESQYLIVYDFSPNAQTSCLPSYRNSKKKFRELKISLKGQLLNRSQFCVVNHIRLTFGSIPTITMKSVRVCYRIVKFSSSLLYTIQKYLWMERAGFDGNCAVLSGLRSPHLALIPKR